MDEVYQTCRSRHKYVVGRGLLVAERGSDAIFPVGVQLQALYEDCQSLPLTVSSFGMR